MANTVAALLRNSRSSLIQNVLRHTGSSPFKPQAIRQLYSQMTLGLDGYVQQKDRTKLQLANIAPKFREKMRECTAEESTNMVFTEDLKNMLHLAEDDEDVSLVIKMLKRFNQQNKQLRFGNYVFGPVIMRMFYFLNKPEEAYQCFKAPELDGLFDQLITYQILLDLLYENKRYNEIVEAFEIIKGKQVEGIKFAKNVVVLLFAALYKLNTKESLEAALKVWSELNAIGHLPMRRATTFCAALVLNQGRPEVALEILSVARNVNYTTIRNLRVAALIELGRVGDALPILRSILHEDSASSGPLQTFNVDVVDRVKAAVEKRDDADMKLEFNRIEKYFKEQGHICDSTLDEQLCQEIALPPVLGRKSNNSFSRRPQFNRYEQDDGFNRYQQDRDPNEMDNRYQRDGSANRTRRQQGFEGQSWRPGLTDLQ